MKTERLQKKNIDVAVSFINDVYADTEGFKMVSIEDLEISTGATVFSGWMGSELTSLVYGKMLDPNQGGIHWACVKRDFRGECHSLEPMQACILELKEKGADRIHVSSWLDSPYRRVLKHFESSGVKVEHGQLTLFLDMQRCEKKAQPIKSGYKLHSFREGDDQTWEKVKNAIFGSSSTASDFWTQNFLGVDMRSDFDPQGFFFAEQEGNPIGICAGLVLHNRNKIGESYLGGIGWTGVVEEHRGSGLGRALMMSALNYLDEKGIILTEVGTQFHRTAALNLYESIGFQIHIASFNLLL
jgi:GNAT superfamily N-acetyltransferase